MGRRIYSASFDNVSISSSVKDVFTVRASSDTAVQLRWMQLTAGGIAGGEGLGFGLSVVRMRLKRGTATVTLGSGGAVLTPGIVDDGDTQPSASTIHSNDTTASTTSGNFTGLLEYFQWNPWIPFDYLPGPYDEDRPACLVNEAFILDFPAPATGNATSGLIRWREYP